jgi:hypothetical protein
MSPTSKDIDLRSVLIAALVAIALPAAAQTPLSPVTGARPGNDIGTGDSLPRGNIPSNVTPGDTRFLIAPNLPTPNVASDGPRAYLVAAQQALAAGRTGEAQEALERAQTRMLDRSVVPSRANVPDQQPGVQDVNNALQALSTGDRGRTQQIIADILARMRG